MDFTPKWTNELLDEMRKHGDPFADEAAAALFNATKGHTKEDVARFIQAFVSHDFTKAWSEKTTIPEPPELINYFESFDEFKLTDEEIG